MTKVKLSDESKITIDKKEYEYLLECKKSYKELMKILDFDSNDYTGI